MLRKVKSNGVAMLGDDDKASTESCLSDTSAVLGEGEAMDKTCKAIGIFCGVIVILAVIGVIIWLSQRPYTCVSSCPPLWLGYNGKCYHFSETEADWPSSQDNCSAMGAVLAVIESEEDLKFVLRYKGTADHWIGLSRRDLNRPWEWVDGTKFNSSVFSVGGGERFAFLNEKKVTSARSSGERRWICTKQQAGTA